MLNKLYLLLVCFSCISALELDISLGDAYSVPGNIIIERDLDDNIEFTSSYKTRGLKSPQYYSIRLRNTLFNKDIELELVHHKLYIDSGLPPEVSKFEITDGFNLLMCNISSDFISSLSCRLGVGVVVAHPDVTINGETNFIRGGGLIPKFWSDGYHWGGISSQASVFHSRQIKNIRYHVETKCVYAKSKIPVIGGSMNIRNISFHLLAGLSFGNTR